MVTTPNLGTKSQGPRLVAEGAARSAMRSLTYKVGAIHPHSIHEASQGARKNEAIIEHEISVLFSDLRIASQDIQLVIKNATCSVHDSRLPDHRKTCNFTKQYVLM